MKVRDLVRNAAETFARRRLELDQLLRGAPSVAERIRTRWAIEEARLRLGPWLSAEEKRFLVHCLWRWTEIKHRPPKPPRRRGRRAAGQLVRRLRLARMAS